MSTRQPRPWYCHDGLVEDYLSVASRGADLSMIKEMKVLQAFVATVGVIFLTALALVYGEADAMVVLGAIVTLGLLNGILAADYLAVVQAIAEALAATDHERDDDGS